MRGGSVQTFREKIALVITQTWPKVEENPFVGVWVELSAKLLAIAIIIVILFLVRKLLDTIIVRFFQSLSKGKTHVVPESRINTLLGVSRSVLRYGIYFIGALTILPEFGINVNALLTAAGVGGLAVGFGAQNLVRDVIAGFFILMEGQFDVGDYVAVADKEGVVESIGLRTTTLLDLSGSRHIIPNGEIKLVTNNMGSAMRVLLDINVGFENNIDEVKQMLERLCLDLAQKTPALVDGPTLLGVQSFSEKGLVFRIKATALPMEQWSLERDLREAFYRGLIENKISVSYPRLEIINAKEKKDD